MLEVKPLVLTKNSNYLEGLFYDVSEAKVKIAIVKQAGLMIRLCETCAEVISYPPS